MHSADAAGDYLQLVERYREMKDAELLVLWQQSSELTDLARQALETEVNQRRLTLEPEPEPEEAPPIPEPLEPSSADSSDQPDPYKEDRELVELCTVWSLRDALQVETLLDRAGIPFFMGPEKATGVAEVTSNFASGVSVQVMQIGLPWTREPMSHYYPEDEPPEVAEEELKEVPMRCPKCRSEDVIFNGLVTEPPAADADSSPSSGDAESPSADAPSTPRYDWICDSCGYEWEDDGLTNGE